MKKKILALVFVFCLLVLSGCVDSGNLKLKPIELSVADFYFSCMDEFNYITQEGMNEIGNETENATTYNYYTQMISNTSSVESELHTIISAMDFCVEIEENSENPEYVTPSQKIYEYSSSNDANSSFTVIVNKQKGKQTYECNVYVLSDYNNYGDIINSEPYISTKFDVVYNKENGGYEFTEVGKKIKGTFAVNKKVGKMEVAVSFTQQGLMGDVEISMQRSFYNYKTGIGGRTISTISQNSIKESFVQEFLSKDIIKRVKFGTVKDEFLYTSMERIEEEVVAKDGEGDGYGFVVDFNATSDIKEPTITIKSYGKFPAQG